MQGESQSSRSRAWTLHSKMGLQGDWDVLEILRATVPGSWLSSKTEGLVGPEVVCELIQTAALQKMGHKADAALSLGACEKCSISVTCPDVPIRIYISTTMQEV